MGALDRYRDEVCAVTMAQLLALGAPKLPAGHFYRVRSNVYGMGFVQIRRTRKGWMSLLLAERRVPRWARNDDGDEVEVTPEDGIRYASEKALEAIQDDLRTVDYWTAFRRWKGDHR